MSTRCAEPPFQAGFHPPRNQPRTPRVTMVFRSKVDAWLAGVMIVALVGSAWAVAYTVRAGEPGAWVAVVILLATWVFVGLVTIPIEYVLEESELVVRSGVWRTRIPYDRITGIRPTRNPLAGPAWSMDRLRIDYRPGRFTLISPKDREEFLRELDLRTGLDRG